MRIALFSDVHGNLAALEAVAAELERNKPFDDVVVAADLLFGGPRPAEVWDVLSSSGWRLVRGNADETLAADTVDQDFPSGNAFRNAAIAVRAWTRARLDPGIPSELAALPFEVRIDTPAGKLVVVHSSPRSVIDRCGAPHNTFDEVATAYGGTDAAAIAFGHWHSSFVRPMPFALLLNVASVSFPLDGLSLASYTILSAARSGWTVEQRRVSYDYASEVAAVHASGKPAWTPDPAPEV